MLPVRHLYRSSTSGSRVVTLRLIVAVGLGAAYACSPAAPVPRASAELSVTATEFAFDQPTLRVEPGQRVHLSLHNQGVIEHNLRVDGSPAVLDAKPGQTARADVTFDQPGTYEFFCSIPGHKEAGMKGQVIVGEVANAHAEHAADVAGLPDAPAQVQPLPRVVARLPQPAVAAPVERTEPALVSISLETREVTALLADGVPYRFWTFNGTVPGPMVRVRQGDTVELTLKNASGTSLTHSINLHAVNGPGGGSVDTQVAPGHSSTIRFQALHPGVYVYHCMTPMVGQHVANGMYGMIVVEPPGGLPGWTASSTSCRVSSTCSASPVRTTCGHSRSTTCCTRIPSTWSTMAAWAR